MKHQAASVFESSQSLQNFEKDLETAETTQANDFIDTRLKKDLFVCVLVCASLTSVK